MCIHEAGTDGVFIGFLRHGVLMLDLHQVRDILAHAQNAHPPRSIPVFELRRPDLPLIACGIRHILHENVRGAQGERDLVIMYKMSRRLGIEDLRIGKPDHAGRIFLVGILCKSLIACQIDSRTAVLGKGHSGHVVQKGGDGFLQLSDLLRFLQFSPVFLILIAHDQGMEHTRSQKISDRIKRQGRKEQLQNEKDSHYQTEEAQRPIPGGFSVRSV